MESLEALAGFLTVHDETVLITLNYNTAADTLECLQSLQVHVTDKVKIIVLDNASKSCDQQQLITYIADFDHILWHSYKTNLGFAAAHNQLLTALLDYPRLRHIILLNSDTRVGNNIVRCLRLVAERTQADMIAGRMWHEGQCQQIESAGICCYTSGLASNRIALNEPLLGPTGGCALYSRRLLQTVYQQQGECFDPAFFCYAEDTDLAWRARLLGFTAAYAADTRIWHKVGRASAGQTHHFVLYHGIRNSLLTLAKNWPLPLLLRYLPWIVLMMFSIVIRHWRWTELKVVGRLYYDAARLLPLMLKKRRVIQASRQLSWRECQNILSKQFYAPHIIRSSLKAVLPRWLSGA